MTQDDIDREHRLDRDESRDLDIYRRPVSRQLTGRGTARELFLQRTDPDANAAGIMNAWRPGDDK
jgi:hypothetical protein